MTNRTFEQPIMELSHSVVFEKAKIINDQYTLSIDDLTATEKLAFINQIVKLNANMDTYIQECIDDACQDRMHAESQWFGGWND